jgi:hypothetical protein
VAKEKDGAVAFVAAGLLVLGFALVTTRLLPARAQARRTLGDEAEFRRRVAAEEAEGVRLEALAAGLERQDPRVLERELRAGGAGKTGEERIVVDPSSRPASR